jgi:hypothetical protein
VTVRPADFAMSVASAKVISFPNSPVPFLAFFAASAAASSDFASFWIAVA